MIPNLAQVEQALRAKISHLAEVEEEEILPDVPLADLGVDSLMALELVVFVEKLLGVRIPEAEIGKIKTLADIRDRVTAGLSS